MTYALLFVLSGAVLVILQVEGLRFARYWRETAESLPNWQLRMPKGEPSDTFLSQLWKSRLQ